MKKLITIALLALSFTAAASASLVGQSAPDDQGYVMCYYEDFNTGEQYQRRSYGTCFSQ